MEDKITIKGIHTFTTCDERGRIIDQRTIENIVVTVGRSVMAQHLAGDTTYSLEITHGALGSDSTNPTNADTTLGSETARVASGSQSTSDNVAYVSFFFPAGTGTGAYEEFGNFCDGSSTPDSGQLFTHVLISGTKAASESLTVDSQYSIT